MSPDYAPLFELSPEQKLRLVEALWDSIADAPQELPMPEWQKEELARRKAAHLADPGAALPWEEVMRRLRKRDGQ
jgi:putative addiction module component (TIGR02574 family)